MPLPFCRRGAFDLVDYLNDITQIETHFDKHPFAPPSGGAFVMLLLLSVKSK